MSDNPLVDFERQVDRRLDVARRELGERFAAQTSAAIQAHAIGGSGHALTLGRELEQVGRELLAQILTPAQDSVRRGADQVVARRTLKEGLERFVFETNKMGRQSEAFGGSFNQILDRERDRVRDSLLSDADASFLDQDVTEAAAAAPAADRIVPLDHNSAGYVELVAALQGVEAGLRGWNGFSDPDERGQALAEVEASQALLKPRRARLEALVAVLAHGLKALLKKVGDTVLGKSIEAALAIAIAFLKSHGWIG